MSIKSNVARRLASLTTVAALVMAGAVVSIAVAPAAAADPGPVKPITSGTVTTDALPTVQIDGIVWSQVVVGNTVYATGNFTNARPAGAAPGVNTTPRSNILAYDITTGALSTTFAPTLNGQGLVITASPDGQTIYVGGSFSQANGVNRYRLAAFRPNGTLITTWAPDASYNVKTIVATASTVYVGGAFTVTKGQTRNRLAAYTAATGALTSWAPSADAQVNALVLTPDGSKVIAGGSFTTINGASAYGLGAIDATTGALLPWLAGNTIKNAGANSAILSLKTDGTSVYGSGYHFGSGGNLEGIFSAKPDTGEVNWIEDCHGDTYDVFPSNDVVYGVNHAHYCGNVGGFPQSPNWSTNGRNALAFTKAVTGTLGHDPHGYFDWFGTPSPSLLNWFPDLTQGTVTSSGQAAWNVTGNSNYIVMGGEFPRVNNVGQQGLVRFAVKPIAPSKDGPQLSGANFVPSVIPLSSGTVRVAWLANHDRDDMTLSYKLVRENNVNAPIYTQTIDSTYWNRPSMGFIDTGLTPGATYRYRLYATDPSGNQVVGDNVSIVAPAGAGVSAYGEKLLADGASTYWPLNEATGNTSVYDYKGFNDGVALTGITRGAEGAIAGNTASTFNGTNQGIVTTNTAIPGPNTFSVSAWFKTTSTAGGKIFGFGDQQNTASGSYDRMVYMDPQGRVRFGVYPGQVRLINSTASFNDGQWHQVVASLGASGMQLYVDGKRVAQRADTTFGQAYQGYWRVGGDNTNGWTGAPTNVYFQGSIDEVAFFPNQITGQQVLSQYAASGRTAAVPAAPADSYGASVYNDDPDLYWRLGETTGSAALDSSPYGNDADYFGTITKNVAGVVTADRAAQFNPTNGTNGVVASRAQFTNPSVYTEEAWVKTTSTRGGKIIGFGNQRSANSSNYDRHVYLQDDGRVVFGVYTTQANTITSPNPVNNGQWHHIVATQAAEGMKLYVDGVLASSNTEAGSQSYVGYWRVGGDVTWGSTSNYLNGTIDEVAVYSRALTAQQVANHYSIGSTGALPNQAPVASFTAVPGQLTASVDGSASTDPDGTVASYAWTFGDGGTATGATATHAYATGGDYTVTLTVTDNQGATNSTSKVVTVTAPNQAPVAAFTSSATDLALSVNGSGSTDPDGTIASYAWTFGDNTTGTGATTSHTYSAGGTYDVTLTVTDNRGGTNSKTQSVTVTAPNKVPTASFTSESTGLKLSVDGSASTDLDGTLAGYAWTFGDGGTATGATASHTYLAAGQYTVALTVTDNDGATNTSSANVTVAPGNVSPTASFTATADDLSVAVDGSASSDPDGTIAGYAWTFGDGGTANGATASHTYLNAGTYDVKLTVTDNKGASTSETKQVMVTAPVQTFLAKDLFARTVTGGWGTAPTGGNWTVSGVPAANFSVAGGVGRMNMPNVGAAPSASLNGLTLADTDSVVDFTMDKVATGGGTFISLGARKVGTSEYRARAKVYPNGLVQLSITKKVGSAETAILTKTVAGLTFTPGTNLRMRFQVSGTATVSMNANLWAAGTAEPSTWFVTATDSSSPLAQGSPVLNSYIASSSTNAPVLTSFSNFSVSSITTP